MATHINNKKIRSGFDAAHRYISIAVESYYMAKIQLITLEENDYIYSELTRDSEEKAKEYIATCVVFCAMANELIINDYLASCFGDKVFQKKYDRLVILEKYKVIENEIFHNNNTDCQMRLKILNDRRRQYVHSKTEDTGISWDEAIKLLKECGITKVPAPIMDSKYIESEVESAGEAIRTVHSLTRYIDYMDEGTSYTWLVFLPLISQTQKKGDEIIKEQIYQELDIPIKYIP